LKHLFAEKGLQQTFLKRNLPGRQEHCIDDLQIIVPDCQGARQVLSGRTPGTFAGSCRPIDGQKSILCSKENHQRGDKQVMGPGVFLLIGLFLILACLFFYRAQKIEALEKRGVRVAAIVTNVEQFPGVSYVTAEWQHPQTREMYTFHSVTVLNQLPLQRGGPVRVLLDPQNYKRYYMPLGARMT
jgi:hypothetical protein